jgi:hypothetical protein
MIGLESTSSFYIVASVFVSVFGGDSTWHITLATYAPWPMRTLVTTKTIRKYGLYRGSSKAPVSEKTSLKIPLSIGIFKH